MSEKTAFETIENLRNKNAMHPPLQKMYKRKEKKQRIKNDRALDGIVSRTLSDLVRSMGLEPIRSPIRPSNVRVCLFRHDRNP